MAKPRPYRESHLIVCSAKDETGRTPFVELVRTGDKIEVCHGHFLNSDEDREAMERVNASVEEARRAERPSVII